MVERPIQHKVNYITLHVHVHARVDTTLGKSVRAHMYIWVMKKGYGQSCVVKVVCIIIVVAIQCDLDSMDSFPPHTRAQCLATPF